MFEHQTKHIYPVPEPWREHFQNRIAMETSGAALLFRLQKLITVHAKELPDSPILHWDTVACDGYIESDLPEPLKPLFQALRDRDLRGKAEAAAVDRLYWCLLVEDAFGHMFLAMHLPKARAWYNKIGVPPLAMRTKGDAAERFRRFVERVRTAHPDVEVDSEDGLVRFDFDQIFSADIEKIAQDLSRPKGGES